MADNDADAHEELMDASSESESDAGDALDLIDWAPPLYRAIIGPPGTVGEQGENEERVRQLIADGADVNQRTVDQGWTPVMASGSTGQPQIMLVLLRSGADPALLDFCGNSAMAWAAHQVRGHDDDVLLSVEPGPANVECQRILTAALKPWSPANHHTFPDDERRLVVHLLHIGRALSTRSTATRQQQGREARERSDAASKGASSSMPLPTVSPLGMAFVDAWETHVIPLVVVRPAVPQPLCQAPSVSHPQ